MLGRNEAALVLFDRMLALWPDDAYALASRAHLRAQAGQLDAALADSRRLVSLRVDARQPPGSTRLPARSGRPVGRSAEPLSGVPPRSAPKLDRAWYGLGLVLIRLQRYDEAVVALKRNTELQPMSPYGWYQLARVHVDRHEPEEARQDHSPPQGLRAQGGRAARARDRAGAVTAHFQRPH